MPIYLLKTFSVTRKRGSKINYSLLFGIAFLVLFTSRLNAQTNGCPWAGEDQTICIGECVTIGCEISEEIETLCFSWFVPSEEIGEGSFQHDNLLEVCPELTTTYVLYVTDNDGNIIATDEVIVNVVNAVYTKIYPPGGLLCDGSSITLSVAAGYDNYIWSNGSTTSSISIDEEGEYSVTVSNAIGCEYSDVVNVLSEFSSNEEISQLLEDAGFLKVPVEIIESPDGLSSEVRSIVNCFEISPFLDNQVGEVLIAEGEAYYCLSDAVIGDIELAVEEGDNVGAIILNNFCVGEYNFENFISFGDDEFEAVMQVFVMDSDGEDHIFVNVTNHSISTPVIVPDIEYPQNSEEIGDALGECVYRIIYFEDEFWGQVQDASGDWYLDEKMETANNPLFYEASDLDNTCCDVEVVNNLTNNLEGYPWITKLSVRFGDAISLRTKFNLGLVNSNDILGCPACPASARKIRDYFYDGERRSLEWGNGRALSVYLRGLEETDNMINQIQTNIITWYVAHDGLSGVFDNEGSDFFENINQPNYSDLLNFGGASLIGGTQNIEIKIRKIWDDCESNEVHCEVDIRVGDLFGAGLSDGTRWKYPGLISQFVLQHFKNNDCPSELSGSEICYTPLVHWINFNHRFTFINY